MSLSNRTKKRLIVSLADTSAGTEVSSAIDNAALYNATAPFHETLVVTTFVGRPAKIPAPVVFNTALGYAFTVNDHEAYRSFRIADRYAGNAKFHVHWTKNVNTDQSGKTVRWRISYAIADGETQDVALVTPIVIDADGTYLDSGTTTRIIYETTPIALSGVGPDKYVYLKIEAVTPAGVQLSGEPVLLAVDLQYDLYINR